ncbi:Crp/Fnr family transcriptional regulator [Lusitaniella coriacea LEGE 07157]|uniref:Crp/Fnr family transcriptional regulator n=1 Tax=Lusitaniella coriacea LEGE 07157 TaxID=945747 RepID=A0A8J7DXI7_9CYAN|nr:Crp/Fnr family transcriptional regulator [Lusitaniella coriacea]MBE9117174.1 Crp/Fnr family transcriptional regulator [Lusitaniella coriacea LEGE 07157]
MTATVMYLPALPVRRTFERRELLPLSPNRLWKIERGVARSLTCNSEGDAIALGYWGDGDLVGQPLSNLPLNIECLTAVEAIEVPAHHWDRFLECIILCCQQNEELLNIVRVQPALLQLWQFLRYLSCKFGREVEQGRAIDFWLTHQQISEALGTTRVTVTRLLKQLEREGKIARDRHRFIVTANS